MKPCCCTSTSQLRRQCEYDEMSLGFVRRAAAFLSKLRWFTLSFHISCQPDQPRASFWFKRRFIPT